MNTNPWFLERMAEYENDRIQGDIKQIYLEKEARQASGTEEKITKARVDRSRPLTLRVLIFVKWMFAWTNKFTHSPIRGPGHQARDEQQLMVAKVSDCTSCGD